MSTLRDKGNEKFKAGEFKEAELLYTEAIHHNAKDQRLFGNRAIARLRLRDWHNAETDARKAIELHGENNPAAMKAFFSLAQALLELRHTTEAMATALQAYEYCLQTKDPSTETVSRFILRAKQAHWQAKETSRLREMNQTLAVVENLLEEQLERDFVQVERKYRNGEIGDTGRTEELDLLQKEADDRRRSIRAAFEDKNNIDSRERAVPDYLIDSITFEIMHDPVMTPSGHSYERIGLLRHVRRTGLDPLTRQSLKEDQLIPNHALRAACSEFIENNGWAVDY